MAYLAPLGNKGPSGSVWKCSISLDLDQGLVVHPVGSRVLGQRSDPLLQGAVSARGGISTATPFKFVVVESGRAVPPREVTIDLFLSDTGATFSLWRRCATLCGAYFGRRHPNFGICKLCLFTYKFYAIEGTLGCYLNSPSSSSTIVN